LISFPSRDLSQFPEKGLKVRVQGRSWMVASPGYLRENNIKLDDDRVNSWRSRGRPFSP